MSDKDNENTNEEIEDMETEDLLSNESDEIDKDINTINDVDEDDDDDDDDDEDEDDEAKVIAKYVEVLFRLSENKYNYMDYTNLIEIAYELNDLEKIRESCELFSSVYPLSPEIWSRWIKLELNISTSDDELENVQKLFQRALLDYFSSDIANEYGNLALKYTKKSEEIWEEILQVYTLHCLDGRKLFVMWRNDFINRIPDETPEKLQKLIKIYKKELEIPLLDMEESYIEFKLFCEKYKDEKILNSQVDWETINRRYNRAKGVLQRILPFENQLLELDQKDHQKRAQIYRKYIKDCGHELDGDIIQILYERMTTECCLNPTTWLDYIKYIQKYGSKSSSDGSDNKISWIFRQNDLNIIEKALRNCTWSSEIYIEKMRSLELNGSPEKDIQSVLEDACIVGFEQPAPLVKIWIEYLTFLYRNWKRDEKEDKDSSVIRANFKLCWDNLGAMWGALADCNCEILQFWGRLEYEKFNEMLKGRDLWLTVMESSDNSTKSGLWIEFAELEMLRAKTPAAREIYKKALKNYEIDNPRTVTSAWTRLERCYGTIDTLRQCQDICTNYLQYYDQQQQTTTVNTGRFNKTQRGGAQQQQSSNQRRDKPSNNDNNNERKDRFKKPFQSPTTTTITELKNLKRPSDQEQNSLSAADEEDQLKRIKFDETTNDIDPTKDHLTVFVSNLDYNVTEDEVRKLFENLNVKSVHLIKNIVTGRGRGFGYIEFDTEIDVNNAYKLDRTPLNGRPTYISSCLRDKSKREKFKYSDELEPTKLFVKGVSYNATKDDLMKLFGDCGSVKDIRIVCHKNGNSKGIAYVDYESKDSAKKAILKLDQFVFKTQTLSVALSAPPPRNNLSTSSMPKIASLGGNHKRTQVRGDAKPRMSFIPQSVQKKVLEAAAIINPTAINDIPTKKSNDDFRKLLNKN